MAIDIKDKVIVVTGAGQGIGRDLCERLDALGATVYAISRSVEPLAELKKSHPRIITVPIDLSNWSTSRAEIVEHFKNVKIDGLVNNAGVAICKPLAEHTERDFDDTMNINVKAIFNVTQALLPNLNDGSSIVNLSSLASLRALPNHSIYSASKAAVDAFTRGFALELAPRNIRVNSVNPTVILTKMSIPNWSEPTKAEKMKSKIPLHRFGELNEVSDPIIFLLSDKSSFINGHSLPIEGGACAC
ncbi:L-xylulose reductase-like [Sitodiplosis mosellana]|uniref:L-xylulose reductase-like n=1 Tax=Sitodiplosis mosellana TaxID=263140 RepID=UPI002444B923|nr:L-xylulose reductase-like [Sitodiplosis mosellana]